MTKTAIILAARRERDSEIPYPLRPFDKEGQTTLMSRTLSILDSLGFDNIVIVAGYKAELFQQLSSPTVHVVINPDYAFTSSMASLARAATLVDSDFLLIESDVICQESLYKQLAEIEEGNCLTVANECGNKDEALVETASGRIVKISKDIHQFCRVDGEMVGISRISRETTLSSAASKIRSIHICAAARTPSTIRTSSPICATSSPTRSSTILSISSISEA